MMLKRTNTEDGQTRLVDADFWSKRRAEERKKQREIEYKEFERELLEDTISEFPNEYYKSEWNDDTPASEKEKIIDQQTFYNMPSGLQQYYLYRQLVNIYSLLSDIKDVVSDGGK